jgi:hypothetical protein
MQDNASDDRDDGPVIERNPGRAVLAVGISVVLLALVATLKHWGWLALLLLPIMAVYVLNVYLGGGLNEAPITGIGRIRTWWAQR